jgi:hypothetical protein
MTLLLDYHGDLFALKWASHNWPFEYQTKMNRPRKKMGTIKNQKNCHTFEWLKQDDGQKQSYHFITLSQWDVVIAMNRASEYLTTVNVRIRDIQIQSTSEIGTPGNWKHLITRRNGLRLSNGRPSCFLII